MDRSTKSVWVWACLLVGGPLLITAFQNCAQMFETPVLDLGGEASFAGNISFSGGCEADLMNLYSQTYYPFLTQTCGSCHTNGPGIGQFGHSDFITSYNAFKSMTRLAVNRNMVNPSHQPPFTGVQNQPALDSFTPRWANAEASYAVCTGNAVAGAGIVSLGKSNAAIIAAAANPATFTKLTWDFSTELKDTKLVGKIPLTFSLEARVATINGVRQGYEFRNPSVKINTGSTGPFRATTMRLYINNTLLTGVTTYTSIDFSANSNTELNMAPGIAYALAVMPNVAATDTFGIEIGDIRNAAGGSIGNPTAPNIPPVTLPATVTLAQLLSNDAMLGVFKQSCVGCHTGAGGAGGLDITNPAQAKLQAADIYLRMNNALNPMPKAGLLTVDKREIVRIWRDTGAN